MGKHTLNKLSPTGIKNKSERGYYADGGGLYFRVSAFDTRSWAFRFTMLGKAREMGLGAYPDVTLMEARERAAEARRLLRDGVDPIEARKATRSATAAAVSRALTFGQCVDAYIAKESPAWKNSKHEAQWRSTLETYAYPVIGKLLVRDVTEEHVLKILEPIWLVKTETASRVRGRIESVLDFAKAKKLRDGDNPARWRGFLDKHLPPAEEPQEEFVEEELPGDAGSQLEKLQHAVATDPANDDARFDYVKTLLLAGRTDDAKVAFAPVIGKVATVRRFESLQRWMDALDVAHGADAPATMADLDAKIAANRRDFDARYGKARLLMAQQQWTQAMDELLEILMRDKSWNEDLARKTFIAILDLIEPRKPKVAEGQIPPDDPTVATYRRRLSSVVLS